MVNAKKGVCGGRCKACIVVSQKREHFVTLLQVPCPVGERIFSQIYSLRDICTSDIFTPNRVHFMRLRVDEGRECFAARPREWFFTNMTPHLALSTMMLGAREARRCSVPVGSLRKWAGCTARSPNLPLENLRQCSFRNLNT